ncbi:MAG TPA: DUF72 domain-containing protein [Acidimicrobiales bacterium]|nr:DUF72 domain-containing protein [Acidimicrobiales bacterium]
MARLLVGTSGWQYRSWRDRFYPPKLPSRRWLEYYSHEFPVVELNTTFYGLPAIASVARWAEQTPEGFCFAAKMSRYLTHIRRLRDPEGPVALWFEHLAPLGARLGPVLFQLPPDLEAVPDRLDAAFAACPRGVRLVVEPRHPSWFTDELRDVLTRHGAVLCAADRRSQMRSPLWRTSDWGYVRLHEGRSHPLPCYGEAALRAWAARIDATWGEDEDVFVFFNNDPQACAPRNARELAELASRLPAHRVWNNDRA